MNRNKIIIDPETVIANRSESIEDNPFVESSSFNLLKDFVFQLHVYEEIGGKLKKIWENHDRVILCFDDMRKYELPQADITIKQKLKDSVGKTVNILRTDIPGQQYFIKIVNPKTRKKTKAKKAMICAQENRSILAYNHSQEENKTRGAFSGDYTEVAVDK